MVNWEEIRNRESLTAKESKYICNELMTTDMRMERLIVEHFTPEDYCRVKERCIGGGRIGGKACGLLLARKLIAVRTPQYMEHMEPHDSFFVGSDVFYQYLVENDCMELRRRHMEEKERFKDADELRARLSQGAFSEELMEELRKIVRHYGDSPVIVRSSSFLEDGFGNAFSGKYESTFCMNQGSEEERLEELMDAIRSVYASTMNPSAIEYRRRWKLLDTDEQMALLIQKVEGQKYDGFYMPVAAGMGCSYNPYKWMENMNPDAGMLRMVMGLGTRAVERTPGDYPRLVCLDRAQANLRTTVAERHKYSQRKVDVMDYETNSLGTRRLEEVIQALPGWQKKLVLSHDTDAEDMLAQRGVYKKVYFADCQGMVNNDDFIQLMKHILEMLEEEYGRPVDVEFAVNSRAKEEWKVNLLQCRPLQASVSEEIHIPEDKTQEFLFDVRRTSMRRSKTEKLDLIVWVDPRKYYEYPYAKKFGVARKIDEINKHFEEEEKKMLLLVPGRIGTSSPELGVPVVYANISEFCAICEVAYSEVGYHPELSYGSHMFQDLVEADVYYGAINENSKTRCYQPQLLKQHRDIFPELWPEDAELNEIIKLYDVSDCRAELMLDVKQGRAVCRLGK
ncbi:PEP/pyruvate-binding domain-containing protein [Dorea sp. D27]|uniref:PEP/pyruvate-binding domain-containing protein n=1 Tax=Dorea sp. D27 TaxID=658665 RepID=UPI0006736FB4|nr:PEP/pyruvate-binding domain-containing protein [Dorea sp. D27]